MRGGIFGAAVSWEFMRGSVMSVPPTAGTKVRA
jgi:hypothetical protein